MKRKIEIGYHASHEQFAPSELIKFAVCAELASFDFIMSADHLNPWSGSQGNSGYSWSWLGAAMAKTSKVKFGTIAIPCGMRYHPVIVAQAGATLAQMFPGRMKWIAAGSGEALNEMVVSAHWPEKEERNAILKEGIEIIRRLWNHESVTKTDGYHYTNEAKIWSLADSPVMIFGAALSTGTAEYLAGCVDGLVTVYQSGGRMEEIIKSFQSSGGLGKHLYAQIHVSWHEDRTTARHNAFEQWRNNLLPIEQSQNLSSVKMFDKMAQNLSVNDLYGRVFIGSEPEYFIGLIDHCISLGLSGVVFHNTGRNQEEFIDFFGNKVLPLVN
jgi:coenzyme F420-dependent glucose-6-phosphate dehydrogenase